MSRRTPIPIRAAPRVLAGVLLGVVAVPASAQTPAPWPADAPLPDPPSLSDLSYRYVGPIGNRVSAVTGVAGDPNVYFVGAASGGVWRSEDGGVHWEPVFDDQTSQSIGAIAVAPSDPNVVWVGTGEPFIRSNVSHGDGVYRSTDGGDTWSRVGLERTGRIGRIAVHPRDPDVAWVAALGHLYGPQEQRGVFKTSDGGRTWERVLFANEHAGAVDVMLHPTNHRIVYAATWRMLIRTWGRWSGGPGSGLWRSMDGGETWERLEGGGLPEPPLGKIGLGVSPDEPDRLYALIETNSNRAYTPPEGCPTGGPPPPAVPACTGEPLEHPGVLWRSEDRGDTWERVSADHTLAQRPLYYTRMAVAPDDADEVHFLSTEHVVSYDGGRTFAMGDAGGDHHDMWIDPELPDRMIVGHDQGISISTDRGEHWMRPPLPIAQMYHVHTDTRVPYYLYGNRQDGPSFRGPSNTLSGGDIPSTAWHAVGGCESGFAIPDTVTNDAVWSGCYDGILDRYEISTGHARTVSVRPDNPEGWPAGELTDRFQWTFPVHISPHDHERVYAGSQRVHVTEDGGASWRPISPDLTTDRDSLQEKTGGLTPDDSSPTYAAVLFAIAESPVEEGVIWAGSNDGELHVTRDGGGSWTDVSASLPDLPPLSTISNVEPSRHEPGKAYVAVDAHQLGDFDPYLYRTSDYGRTWERIDAGIPRTALSWTHVIREDPDRPGLLYAGTESGLYVSPDDGERWIPLQNDLPRAPVHWIDIQAHFDDLVVGTYGRGFWILDDITPLQRMSPDVLASGAHLFRPRPAYRFLEKEGDVDLPDDPAAGENPEYGASLHLWLGEDAGREGDGSGAEDDAPAADTIRVEIFDADGVVRRTLDSLEVNRGLNRFHWDLREEPSEMPKLRTPPLEHGHVEMPEPGWRELEEGGRVRPLAPPGEYTVRAIVGVDTLERPLTVLKDPHSAGTPATVAEQVEMVREIRGDVNAVVELIDRIEWMRARLLDLETRLARGEARPGEGGPGRAGRAGGEGAGGSLRSAADSVEALLVDVEMNLFDLRLSGGTADQDTLRWPRRLFAKLVSLARYVTGSDHAPTEQAREVHREYRELLSDYEARLEEIREGPLDELNRRLLDEGVTGGPIALRPAGTGSSDS